MGIPGKPEGIDGSEVERYFLEGTVKEIAEYCEADVVNTHRVWLRYELFRGWLNEREHQASERSLAEFIRTRQYEASFGTADSAKLGCSVAFCDDCIAERLELSRRLAKSHLSSNNVQERYVVTG